MKSQVSSDETDDLRALLNHDHARLDALFERFQYACAADLGADLSPLWAAIETGLIMHLELEERYLLPKFEQLAPAEAAVLVREHAEIRKRLSELGLAIDLRLARAEEVHEFIQKLRSHAAREDALLYRWAQTHVVGGPRSVLRAYLLGTMRKAYGTPSGALETDIF